MKERVLGLDLIRFFCFVAIVIFHSTWVIWRDPLGPPDPGPTALWRVALLYARIFAFSGFVITFLTSFLIGTSYTKESRRQALVPKLVFILLGWIVFCFCLYLKEGVFHLMWDIYPLLLVGIASERIFLRVFPKLKILMLILSCCLLSVPFWKFAWQDVLSFRLGEALVGRCPEDYADWPILPWIGLVWLGLIVGQSFSQNMRVNNGKGFGLRKIEGLFWVPAGGLLFLFSDVYFRMKFGDAWACYTFRQNPFAFWGHFLLWLFLGRLAIDYRVQRFLTRSKLSLWISSLAISRFFYLAYLIHFVVIFALVGLLDPQQKADNPMVLDSILLLTLPLTEILVRFFAKAPQRSSSVD